MSAPPTSPTWLPTYSRGLGHASCLMCLKIVSQRWDTILPNETWLEAFHMEGRQGSCSWIYLLSYRFELVCEKILDFFLHWQWWSSLKPGQWMVWTRRTMSDSDTSGTHVSLSHVHGAGCCSNTHNKQTAASWASGMLWSCPSLDKPSTYNTYSFVILIYLYHVSINPKRFNLNSN